MKEKQVNLKTHIYTHLMISGNKHICENKFLKTLKILQKKNKKNNREIIKMAVVNSAPIIQLRQIKKRKRKSVREFPYVLKEKNRISLGIKAIVKIPSANLFKEILTFANKKNELLKSKEVKQKLALSKKKYIFFRWFF